MPGFLSSAVHSVVKNIDNQSLIPDANQPNRARCTLSRAICLAVLLSGAVGFAQSVQAETYTFPNSWWYSNPGYTINYTDSDGTFTLAWNFDLPTDGSDLNFVLYKKIGTSVTPYSTTSFQQSFSNLPAGTYEFHILASYWFDDYWDSYEEYFFSSYRLIITVPPPVPGTPSMNMATTDSDGDYSISWGGVANATSYKWQERVNGGSWSDDTTTSLTSASRSGKPSTTYGYRVKACNSSGCGAYSSERSVIVAITPGIPASITADPNPSSGNVTVSWGSASGSVTYYDFDYKISTSGTWINGYDGAGLSKALTGLSVGIWNYQVRACKTVSTYTSCSTWRENSSSIVPSIPVISLASTDNDGNYTVSWNAVSGATSYKWQERINGGSWSGETSTTATELPRTKGSATYGYHVSACNAVGCSAYSAEQSIIVAITPGVPSSISASPNPSSGDVTVSWGSASGDVTKYDFDYKISTSSTWINGYDSTGLSKALTGLSAGTWNYQVRACKTESTYTSCSDWRTGSSTVEELLLPLGIPGPIDGPAVSQGGEFYLSWQPAENGDGDTDYLLQQRYNSGDWSQIYLGSGELIHQVHTVANGNYEYRVSACRDSNCTDYSAIKPVFVSGITGTIETPPQPVLATAPAPASTIDQTISLNGEFDVSSGGQATYNIPIEVAAGSGGFAPSISLNYNSGSGNGVAGWGWSLSGLGSISRCRQTESQDKNAAPITWTEEDRFCLNGERLMVTSGTYGAPNSEYRTEIESYARITALGGSTGHPDRFKVEYKDGRIDYYGGNASVGIDAAKQRFDAVNPKTYRWLLRYRTDSAANRMIYYYNNSGFGPIPRITDILCGGDDAEAGHIRFHWELRQDKIRGYIAGYEYWNEYRLQSIEAFGDDADNTQIRNYNLHYEEIYEEPNEYDRVSRLSYVQPCRGSTCGRATYFAWTIPTIGSVFSHSNVVAVNLDITPKKFAMGDINGDGLQDLIWTDNITIKHSLASVDSNGQLQYTPTPLINGGLIRASGAQSSKLWMIDYNADGRDDLVFKETANHWEYTPGIRVYLSTPTANGGWALSTTPAYENIIPLGLEEFYEPQFVDINGDGLQDVVDTYSKKVVVQKPDEYGQYYPMQDIQFVHPVGVTPCDNSLLDFELHPQTGDFNGDGRIDFIAAVSVCNGQSQAQYQHTFVYTSHPLPNGGLELHYFDTLYEYVSYDVWDSDARQLLAYLRVADLNNDGLSDVINGSWIFKYRFSTGTGFTPEETVTGMRPDAEQAFMGNTSVVDMNGDGYPDLASYYHDIQPGDNGYGYDEHGTFWTRIRYWDPYTNSFSADFVSYASPYYLYSYNTSFNFTDMNGDKLPDLVSLSLDGPSGGIHVNVVPQIPGEYLHPYNNIIKTIWEINGESINIQYDNLGQSEHYSYLRGVNSTTQEQVCQDTEVGDVCWNNYEIAAISSTAFYDKINNPFPSGTFNQSLESPPLGLVFNINSSMPVVTDVSGKIAASYYYHQARMEASGRGYLGFKRVVEVDRRNGLRKETDYRQDWPFTGRPLSTTLFNRHGAKLQETTMEWGLVNCDQNCVNSIRNDIANGGIAQASAIQPYMSHSLSIDYYVENDNVWDQGPEIRYIDYTRIMDDHGNIFAETEETYGESYDNFELRKSINNIYDYSGATWSMQQGRLSNMTVTSSNTLGSITRQSTFTYYPAGPQIGLVETETLEPDYSEFTQTTTHTYDNFGNRTQSITTGGGETRYSPRLVYDSTGRYVDEVYERFNDGSGSGLESVERLVSRVASRDYYGNPTYSYRYVDSNTYIAQRAAATSLGVPYFSSDSSGAWSLLSAGLGVDSEGVCPGSNNTDTHQYIKTAGGGESIVCFDRRNRKIREATRLFNGAWSRIDTEYDSLDRVVRKSEPYIQGSEKYWTKYKDYDPLNRAQLIEHPDYPATGAATVIDFQGFGTLTTNPLGQIQKVYKNALGQVISTFDPMNGNTSFTYDARGNLKTMRDPGGNTTTIDYDLLDRKIGMSDPDKGNWIYQYNHMGELTCQNDANGQVIEQRYDFRGRMIRRYDNTSGTCGDTNGSEQSAVSWIYDTADNGFGQLARVWDGETEYDKTISYDRFGRVSQTTTGFLGVNNQFSNHYEKVTYDQYGRVFQMFDAARASDTFENNGVQYIYNPYGYLYQVNDVLYSTDGQSRNTYYQVDSMNARGNVTEATYGNGVLQSAAFDPATGRTTGLWANNDNVEPIQNLTLVWDVAGNLTSRHETGLGMNMPGYNRDLREDFDYDALNRLTQHQLSGDASGVFNIFYNSVGNITQRSSNVDDWNIDYYYGKDCTNANAGPHAVCETQGDSLPGGYNSYVYDNNGNQTSGAGRTIAYTVFDKPKLIQKGSYSTAFSYGPDRARYKRIDNNGSDETTTLYIGSVEKVYYEDGTIQWKRNINGVGLIVQTVDSGGNIFAEAQNYFIKDHLGSINLITDQAGNVIQAMDYDPWGKRRNIESWNPLSDQDKEDQHYVDTKPTTTRGFTGHEMLDEMGLVHMNGRIYDDTLARFVQADPIIQDPNKSQSLNRYSYVWNNPLNATDPSGFAGNQECDEECELNKLE
ncbi:MAG: hypothetical protein JXA04_04690, partial [Gammaproteobacteria bacterium]|nr:hypothetical protein [Gammaproteobacteria bacterium]